MFVLSHDKKTLMEIAVLKVEKNFGGRGDAKFALIGTSGAENAWPATLAFYATEEEAITEIEHIMAAINAGNKIYTISD